MSHGGCATQPSVIDGDRVPVSWTVGDYIWEWVKIEDLGPQILAYS